MRMTFVDTRAAHHAAPVFGDAGLAATAIADGSFARAVLRHLAQVHEAPDAAARFLADRQSIELLANTALPGAEYLLALRRDRSVLIIAGAPDASQQLQDALTPCVVDGELFHVRVHTSKVTLAGINEVRAACIADIDWNLKLDTVPSPGAPDRPLQIVRRAGHPIATGVVARRLSRGAKVRDQRLIGQLSIPDALCELDRVRIWHLITSAAVESVGRLVQASDEVTVNEMPCGRWLAGLTCGTDARMAQWLGYAAT